MIQYPFWLFFIKKNVNCEYFTEGWGWPGAGPVDPKLGGDPAMAMAPIMDGYPVPEGTAPLPG